MWHGRASALLVFDLWSQASQCNNVLNELSTDEPKQAAHYNLACDRCEHKIDLDRHQQVRVRAAMSYDKLRSGPPGGRRLQTDLADLALDRHDRLEPSAAMPDVAMFDNMPTPVAATFWNSSLDTLTRRRNPLFVSTTGLSIENLGIDSLHALSLGCYQVFVDGTVLGLHLWKRIRHSRPDEFSG